MVVSKVMWLKTLIFISQFSLSAHGVYSTQVIADGAPAGVAGLDLDLPVGACTEIRLGRDRELPIYKDFTLLGLIEFDPKKGERISERPLLGDFSGVVHLNRLGPPRQLKTLSMLARILSSGRGTSKAFGPESLFVPVMLCGDNSYQSFLGYMELEAFRLAREDSYGDKLPPSTVANPIPHLKPDLN